MNSGESIVPLMAQISTAFRISLERQMNQIGLHGGQVFVLAELWQRDGQTQVELARSMKVSPPTVNKMVRSLSDAGFVTTGRSETDTRLVLVHLTDRGRHARAAIFERWQILEEELLTGLTDTEKLIFGQLLGKIRENLRPDAAGS